MALGICKRNIAISCIITFGVVCYNINRLSITGFTISKFDSFVRLSTKLQNYKSIERSQKESFSNTKSNYRWMEQMEEKYKIINDRINEVCQRYRQKRKLSKVEYDMEQITTTVVSNTFLFDTNHKLAFCQNKKVGTTTWLTYFYKLMPPETLAQNMTDRIQSLLKNRNLVESKLRIPNVIMKEKMIDKKSLFADFLNGYLKNNDYITFSFVRHPFRRLVSCYKNFVLKWDGYGMKLFGYSNWYINNHSFPAFIDLVLGEWQKDKCYKSYNFPCLKLNQHWRPLNSQCLYCDILYNVIGRMETFSDDVQYILIKANLTSLVGNHSKVVNSSKDVQLKTDKRNETLHYFSQLKKPQVDKLYRMYDIDFEMFNYKNDIYF